MSRRNTEQKVKVALESNAHLFDCFLAFPEHTISIIISIVFPSTIIENSRRPIE